MIVYRELSSLSADLGFSSRTLYSLSNQIEKHYHTARIPKGNGEYRELQVPDRLLKTVQRRIADRLLPLEEISAYATAYRPGGSPRLNAMLHTGKPLVVKLDIRHFFDHIIYPLVKEKAFHAARYSERNRILLAILCTYDNRLPQGAPTSPAISNIIMKDFDDGIGAWCAGRNISCTRYCDDMTFSGDFDPGELITRIKAELQTMGFSLNSKKTVIVRQGQRQQVTGIVVNEAMHVPADYKRQIRQEIYYCEKYGAAGHLAAAHMDKSPAEYLRGLLGRVNYVLSVEPDNEVFRAYRTVVTRQIVSQTDMK